MKSLIARKYAEMTVCLRIPYLFFIYFLFFFQEILYLSALFGMKKGKSAEDVMQLLQETVESHFATLAVSKNEIHKFLFYLISNIIVMIYDYLSQALACIIYL